MRFPVKTVAGLAVIAAVGGVIYGWGIGLFYPCGPVDKVFSSGACRILVSQPDAQFETLLQAQDGLLLTVIRQDGMEPTRPQRLAEINAADGRVISETALADMPPNASWINAALSPDGSRIAGSSLNERIAVIERSSGALIRRLEPFYNVAHVGFVDDDTIMIDRGNVSSERPPALAAQTFAVGDGGQIGDISGEATWPLYQRGLAMALSPDGALLAQHAETRGDAGVVAIRLADAKFIDWAGQLLVAPLGASGLSSQIWPRLWFSPDSKYLAAAFDGAPAWGKETAALLIWDVSQRKLVQSIPTYHADWDELVWLEGRQEVAVTRFNRDTRTAEIAVIKY